MRSRQRAAWGLDPMKLGLETAIVDTQVLDRTAARCRERNILLPTFAQLADPDSIPDSVWSALAAVDPDTPHPMNLFRVHWFNDDGRTGRAAVPAHVVLPPSITGTDAVIVVAFGDRFPMIRAHKVLAAYGCLAPRLATGQFDPTTQRALWPSTGNYCRGGVAISRLLGCRSAAVLPEGMSRERFEWLDRWTEGPDEIIKTPGTESNVKEIYDACTELEADPQNLVLNQFCDFGNHVVHRLCTGRALERLARQVQEDRPGTHPALFVSATGSAGTLGAGDHLKVAFGLKCAAVEPLECPTLLYNGYGEHNIQGIGDRHVPLIHNVMGTDLVIGVTDRATDHLLVLLNTDVGRAHLADQHDISGVLLDAFRSMGLSSLANVIASIKAAKRLGLGRDDIVLTVATDGAAMYASEIERISVRDFPSGFDAGDAGEAFESWLSGATTDHVLELETMDRERIFNLGYFTWVEQQGVSLAAFEARRSREFWDGLPSLARSWDEHIIDLNRRSGVRT